MGEPADRAGEQCRQHVISAGGRGGAERRKRRGGGGGERGSARSYIFARLWPDDGRNFPHLRRSGSQRCLDNRICSRLDCRRPFTGVFVDAGYRRDHGYNHASLTDRSEAVSMSSLSISLNACARGGGGINTVNAFRENTTRHTRWAARERARSGCRRACGWTGSELRLLYEIWYKA
jgi:hypothetical protein